MVRDCRGHLKSMLRAVSSFSFIYDLWEKTDVMLCVGYVVPGFIDSHAHWDGTNDKYPATSWEMQTFLAYGVTTLHKCVIFFLNLSAISLPNLQPKST